jgi:hypothetical protein
MANIDVRRENRRLELRRSLQNPHAESLEIVQQGVEECSWGLPDENIEALLDSSAGRHVRWVSGEGWVEMRE